MDIEKVYREVAPKLQSYLTGNGLSYATACDIVQETFLRLWKKRDELSDDPHQVSGLAFTIARNYRNDLMRKARHEVLSTGDEGCGMENEAEVPGTAGERGRDEARPGEAEESLEALKRRLKASLERMPVQLLETFALSRLGTLSVKDIANGTGVSEASVKVRVHRAKAMFGDLLKGESAETRERGNAKGVECEADGLGGRANALKAMMMLAAVDGEVAKEELAFYRELADGLQDGGSPNAGGMWERSVRAMAYVGFLSEMLPPEALVREFVREASKGMAPENRIRLRTALERMAAVDGEYSRIERACVQAFAGCLGQAG